MPIILTGIDNADVRFAASPLIELGAALHVLQAPGHHGRAEWARQVAAPDDVALWSFTYRAFRARVFAEAPTTGVASWAAERARLDRMRPEDLALALVRPLRATTGPGVLTSAQTWARAERWAAARGPDVARLVSTLRRAPDQATADFLSLLDRCWDTFFADEWAAARPALAGHVARGTDLARRDGPLAAVTTLVPATVVDRRRGGVVLEKVASRRIDVSTRGLVLVPSTFIGPHVHVGDEPGSVLTVVFPMAVPVPVPTARQVLDRLAALAHPVRFQVCRAVASEPRSAGEIASRWGLEPTQVTKHLRALTRAGILRTERAGRYVRYRLDDDAVRSLGTDVADLLQR